MLREITEVLARPKFAGVLTEERRREALELLAAAAFWIEPQEAVRECRDPKDDCYLELALAAGASAILTGDQDLLVLHPGGIRGAAAGGVPALLEERPGQAALAGA